jgi:hypothetical protein
MKNWHGRINKSVESKVDVKYVYEVIHSFLDADLSKKEMEWELSRFLDELANNYKIDTGKLIGEDI